MPRNWSMSPDPTRRDFLLGAGAALALGARPGLAEQAAPLLGKAERCIFLWLGGGMSQIDTFDPKGKGDPKLKKPGCAYGMIPTAVSGVRVTEHLSRTARLMDRLTVVRTLFHTTVDEHATATHFVHTGRSISETIRYPSIGGIVAHELGGRNPAVPPYVVIGYPNASRDPGFLGARNGYLSVTRTDAGPSGFVRHEDVTGTRQARRERLLGTLRKRATADPGLKQYDDVLAQSLRLAGPEFTRLFDLKSEAPALRESYGGEFGQRCLLARRLVESGTRFVEVSHNLNFLNGTGWDTHNEGQLSQHLLIQELDQALSALISDLERRGSLDKTLIAFGTEFGRPAAFDAGGGRGHHSKCFSLLLAGGGLLHRGAYGETDDLAQKALTPGISIPDYHATLCAALGINPSKELYDGTRPVPVTDGGKPIRELFG